MCVRRGGGGREGSAKVGGRDVGGVGGVDSRGLTITPFCQSKISFSQYWW